MPEQIFERRSSFNAGEISPWLDPRIDQEKYHLGCRELTNMRPTIYGGAFSRPGTVYLGEAGDMTGRVRLIGFEFEAGTSYILEFSDNLLRVWETGAAPALVEDPDNPGNPLEISTPWPEEILLGLQFCQLNDLLFVTHPSKPPRVIARYAGDDWRIVLFNPDWPAVLPENDRKLTLAVTSNHTTPAAWSSATTYDVGDEVTHESRQYACRLEDCVGIEPGDHKNWKRWWRRVKAATLGIGRRITLTASKDLFETDHAGTKWVLVYRRTNLKESLDIAAASAGDTTTGIYCLGPWSASLLAENTGTAPWNVEVTVQRSFDNDNWEVYKTISGGIANVQQILSGNEPEPCFLRLKLSTKGGAGSVPTNYKAELEVADRDQHAIVKIKSVTSATVAVGIAEFPAPSTTDTEYWHEPAWSHVRGFPRAITIHNSRLWFGGTSYQPTTVWGTGLDRFETFRIGDAADLGKEFQLQSDEANAIQWLCSQDALIIGTAGAEWFYGQRIGEDLPKIRRNTSFGSARIQARVVNESIVYVQRSQRRVREFAWNAQTDSFQSVDLTMLAEHFGDEKFLGITIQRNPETVVWIVTNLGSLIGMTYERQQNVAGWFRYETEGLVESIAVVPGTGEEDEVWISTRRNIDGNVVRYVERFQPEQLQTLKTGDQADLVCSDAALIYDSTATDTITGLDHLEGETVAVLADGAPHPDCEVSGGEITLQYEASTVVVGLPFTATLEPTYLETSDPGTITKAFHKRILSAHIEFWKSLGVEVSGDAGTNWHPIEFRQVDDYMDQAPPLFSGIKTEHVEAGSERQASVILRQTQPLPLNVLSLTMRFTMGTA